MIQHLRFLSLGIGLALFLGACQVTDPTKLDNDKEIFAQAEEFYRHGRYEDAISFYQEITNSYPQSPFVVESELKIAQAYFEKKDFFEAGTHFLSFQSLHPTHEKSSFVAAQIGLCQFKRAPKSPTKDQTQTRRAVESFKQVMQKWPDSEEAKMVAPYLEKAQVKLDESEYSIARFYFRQRNYAAVLKRLEDLKENALSYEIKTKSWFLLGKTHYRMKNHELAQKAFETVAFQDKDLKRKKKAQHYLSKLKSK
ncbi:MAG: outer membrane protein assembly factor BamD [Bdellovibrionota bacterium]